MPSRPLVVAIVAFWLAANGWLVYREVWPSLRTGEPPPYSIDLTQELGRSTVNWKVLQDGVEVGTATWQVTRLPDRTYEMRTQYRFTKLNLPLLNLVGVHFTKLTSTTQVTEDGDLLALSAQLILQSGDGKRGPVLDHELEMRGEVRDGKLVIDRFFHDKAEVKLGEVSAPVSATGSTFNPMHPVNRITGLHEGRQWRVPLFDPTKMDLSKMMGAQIAADLLREVQGVGVPVLEANVAIDEIEWNGEQEPCFKIDYRKPGEPDVIASTWVRRSDGLVLQQHSRNDLMELTLRREPVKQ